MSPDTTNMYVALELIRLSGLFSTYLQDPKYASTCGDIRDRIRKDHGISVPEHYTPGVDQGFGLACAYTFLVFPKEFIRTKRSGTINSSLFPSEDELIFAYDFVVNFGPDVINRIEVENSRKIDNLLGNSVAKKAECNPYHSNYPEHTDAAERLCAIIRCLRNSVAHSSFFYTPGGREGASYSWVFVNLDHSLPAPDNEVFRARIDSLTFAEFIGKAGASACRLLETFDQLYLANASRD